MKKLAITVPALCCLLTWTVPAQGVVGEAEEKGRKIVEEAVAALGGEKFLAMQDRVASGWTGTWHGGVSRNVRTRIYTLYSAAGMAERHAFDKNESYAALFNDSGAWEITYRGARPMEKPKAERFSRDARFNILQILRLRMNEPGMVFAYRGSEVCEKQMGDVVEVISRENEPVVRVCFNRNTRLPLRQSYFRLDPLTKDRIEEVTLFSRYHDAGDGVMWPRQISWFRDGEPVSEIFLESVHVNQGLTPERFTLAPGMKRLKPLASFEPARLL
ncbi:MAG: hypothetical protein SFV51_10820 [Bryobacteraceae bacterium]|nr:hypothetical protein [Bryobacteraceae bacterium]